VVRRARRKPGEFLTMSALSPICKPRLMPLMLAAFVVRLTRRHDSPYHPRASTRWTDSLSTLEFRELPSDADTNTQRREVQQ
jgi:hypothetical protein